MVFSRGVSSPPKPPIEIELGAGSRALVPELSEGFFQQVGTVDLQVQLIERRVAQALALGEVSGVFQPQVASSRHHCL
jgi:hypothetical protein